MSQENNNQLTGSLEMPATANNSNTEAAAESKGKDNHFNPSLIKSYPKSNRKLSLNVSKFGISAEEAAKDKNGQSVHISPHGIEFRTTEDFQEGSLLKIHVAIPDYWSRKQKFVDYTRIDSPDDFRVLAKVVKCEDVGKRGKKRIVTVQTLVIDDVDEQVLKTFLQEG